MIQQISDKINELWIEWLLNIKWIIKWMKMNGYTLDKWMFELYNEW